MPRKILVVEDSETMAEGIRQALASADTTVETVADGLAAWDRVSQDVAHFDVIVTDHFMPTLPGNELAQLLREAGFAGRVVVYSGNLSPEIVEAYRALSVTEILEKGNGLQALIQRLGSAG